MSNADMISDLLFLGQIKDGDEPIKRNLQRPDGEG